MEVKRIENNEVTKEVFARAWNTYIEKFEIITKCEYVGVPVYKGVVFADAYEYMDFGFGDEIIFKRNGTEIMRIDATGIDRSFFERD